MREGEVHDNEGGGYFRTCSNADWSRPHREKLLAEQAGLLSNCLHTFRLTQSQEYADMAEDIIDYLNRRLSNPGNGVVCGCEVFLRVDPAEASSSEEFFSIIDACVYTDAGAQAIIAYLDAGEILGKFAYKERALHALEFLWDQCRNAEGGMFHYFEGVPRVSGLLNDQARMGTALVQAYKATNEIKYLERAKQLAEFILARLKNPAGGYYDITDSGPAYLSFRLTLIEQNGPAASFLLALAEATREPRYRDSALWALSAFPADFGSYGVHAAGFGQALNEFMIGR